MKGTWAIRVWIAAILVVMFLCLVGPETASAQYQSSVEATLSNFIKKTYDRDQSVDVQFAHIPRELKGRPNITNISFVRTPDARGDGICLVEIGRPNRGGKNVYVPFRLIKGSKVFVLTESAKRGDMITEDLVLAKEIDIKKQKTGYPLRAEDILGKVLKRNVAAGTVITGSLLDDPILIQRGEVVTIIVENRRLLVQAKGKALERGKMGDSIRVKNISSEKEIFGKVVGDNTVSVSF